MTKGAVHADPYNTFKNLLLKNKTGFSFVKATAFKQQILNSPKFYPQMLNTESSEHTHTCFINYVDP